MATDSMGCESVRELLPLFAGGELEAGERLAAEAHLGYCAECARELDAYRVALAGLARSREEEPPSGTWQALAQGVHRALFPAKRDRRPLLVLARSCAAALLLGLVVGLAAHHLGRRAVPAAAVRASDPGLAPITASGPSPSELKTYAPPREARLGGPEPRLLGEGEYYLPRAETIPPGAEKDF